MSVVANRQGRNAVVTVTVPIGDIIDLEGISNAEKRQRGLIRALEDLQHAVVAATQTDAQIDDAVTKASAAAAARKAARPTGNL